MDIKQMHIALEQELNKVNSNLNSILLRQEKDFALNKNIERFIKQRYGAQSNLKGKGFEMSQKRYEDLRSLVVPNYRKTMLLTATDDADYPNKLYSSFASDHSILLNSRVTYVGGDCTSYAYELTSTSIIYTTIDLKAILSDALFDWDNFRFGFYDGNTYHDFLSKAQRPGVENYSQTEDFDFLATTVRDYVLQLWSDRLSSGKKPKFQVYFERFQDIYAPGSLIFVWENISQNIPVAYSSTYTTVPSGVHTGLPALTSVSGTDWAVNQILLMSPSSTDTYVVVVDVVNISGTYYYVLDKLSGANPSNQAISLVTRYSTFYYNYEASLVVAYNFEATLVGTETVAYPVYQVNVDEESGEAQPTAAITTTRLTQQDDFSSAQQNPWFKTGTDSVLVTVSENDFEAYQDVDIFIVKDSIITYLRLPILVSWYMNISCDLPSFTHDEIVSMTASYLLEEFESGRYQTQKETVVSNE